MRESSTFQAILDEGRAVGRIEGRVEGRVEGAVRALLLVATPRLGEPDAALRQRLESETDLAQVEEWLRHAAHAESWSDLPGLLP